MILTHKLTDTGDLDLDTLANPTIIQNQDAIDQITKMGVALWRGDWFRDLNRGVDWIKIFKKATSKKTILQRISSALLALSVVDKVVDVTLSKNAETRTASINFTVLADNEETTVTVA